MELSTLIKRAQKTDMVITAYVYGEFGHGKTSYALWTAYEVLGSWNKVLDHLFFDPAEAVQIMEKAVNTGERLPIIIMDDAGLWLDRLTWWETDKVAFIEFFNLIRSIVAGVIFTTPSEELPRQIIKKCFFRIAVKPTDKDTIIKHIGIEGYQQLIEVTNKHNLKPIFNIATGYKLKTLPSFMEYVKKEYYDFYPLQYPIHKTYNEKRQKALRQYFEKWRAKVEASKTPTREDLKQLAKELLLKGKDKSEVAKELIKRKIPRATAYRWINKILSQKE